MSMSKEYQRLTETFIEELPYRIYIPQGNIEFCGFFTYDRLSLEEAKLRPVQPMPHGTEWGKKWQYGWFFAEITIPPALEGQRIMFEARLGECVVFINDKVAGAFDQRHSHITLTSSAKAGEVFSITMEVYAGHNGVKGNGLLVSPKNYNILIPEKNITEYPEDVNQKVISDGSFGTMREDVFQLWMDIQILYDLRNNLEENSLRRATIDKALKKVCDTVDIEDATEEFSRQLAEAREILKPLLQCKNSPTTPVFYAIGNSHLDLEWMWTVNETRRKCARTLGNQLKLIEDYPKYKYFHSQPWTLEIVKNEYPELYERVKKAVKNGNIIVNSGTWVEPDTNIPSGESIIRQFVFGKRFVKEEFGNDSNIFWLPDSFGMSGALPQIMKGCGIRYFMNAKVTWLYNDGEPFPHGTFCWEGIDGSQVLSHIMQGYALEVTPTEAFRKWKENPEKEDVPVGLFPYGYGDGGGGATRVHLEALERTADLEGHPRMLCETPEKMYEYISQNCDITKKHVGEIYYPAHRGTYTSQAKTKKGNRQAEFSLREAEMWSAFNSIDTTDKINRIWKDVLFNQFHDILPGSSLKEVHRRAEESYNNSISAAKELTDTILKTENIPDTITLFNSLSWNRKTVVELPRGYTSADGCETQQIGDKIFAMAEVPACGQMSYKLGKSVPTEKSVPADSLVLENELIRAEFNTKGQMISLVDKEKNTEFLSAPSNLFRLYKDMPTFCDSWDIDSFYENVEIALEDAVAEAGYNGNLISCLTISGKINKSAFKQKVLLKKGSRTIEFETEIDWQERHRLLKVDFNTNIHTDKLISEIQFGYIERPAHRNRQQDADKFEVCQQKWSALTESKRTFALLNDCKYGISAIGGKISLTLLKSGAMPDLTADKGVQTFTYSVMPVCDSLCDSNVVRCAYELNSSLVVKNGYLEKNSFANVSPKNVILDTAKLAEDGSGDVIIRLYESMNTLTTATLDMGFGVKKAYLTDMLENIQEELEVADNKINITLTGFKIATIRIERE